jgi:hypothetical protein
MQTVLFVCLHGAMRSRLAAAFFNRAAPPGWWATSAGLEPDPAVSPNAVRLLADDEAEAWLDREPPRPLAAVAGPTLAIAIDCAVDGAERWTLAQQRADAALRDELRARAEALAARLG